tara:strand:- start:2338 stop:3345 length:1008 start_codon:yes stop_codon:yes gene_type:complete
MNIHYNWKIIRSLSIEKRYLIDYANLKSSLLFPQKQFSSYKDFLRISKKNQGIPILLPIKDKHFTFTDLSNSFNLNEIEVAKYIFLTNNINYPAIKFLFRKGYKFSNNYKIKKKYAAIVNDIVRFNKVTQKLVKDCNKHKSLVAFQTRNIPHYGHEKIIEFLLTKFDVVAVNPIIGPKKKGDIKNSVLKHSWRYLINNIYGDRLKFWPIISNMFYAGPKEALNHSILRQNIGFKNFLIGRDHAGMSNFYKNNQAINFIKKHNNQLKIDVTTINGAFYSKSKKRVIVVKNFNQYKNDLVNISGTNFRNHLEKKQLFKRANQSMQKYIFSRFDNLFQ